MFAIGTLFDSPDNPYSGVAISLFCIVFTIIGACYAHKLMQWPKVTYLKPHGSLTDRIIAMLWFGTISELIFYSPIIGIPALQFASLLSAALGFCLGYRILLLPNTLRAFIKVLMIALIGTSAAVFFTSFIVVLMFLLSGMELDLYINAISGTTLTIFLGFIVFSIITYPWVLLGSLLFYFTSALFKKIKA
tara:strand:- start:374 stop:946 length:573 start_codon:yes stop_codon:yes gene_type:complete